MGIGLVQEALLPVWAGLSPFSRLVLVQMATRAYDETHGDREGRLYYGGHGFIGVMLLGVGDGDPGWPTAKKRIQRAVGELIAAGAIEVVGQPVNGNRACYAITTNRTRLAVDNCPAELADPDRQGSPMSPQGTPMSPEGTPVSP
ncbi:hypothetical protein G7085_12880 [Tessaracoccus sp. HDW20]|uniref:hypothetical protein n=1 Tax=Tessaracoccus coleopterorum TaxID=2714950 RepID=UPI001E529653|nr:hypothetical protein [Tessaracoccus coleopterorum]NHB85219.1 hypothetical protein [Tessaracoccus coleopterorum]